MKDDRNRGASCGPGAIASGDGAASVSAHPGNAPSRDDVAAVWRCAVADVVAMIDGGEVRRLRMSRRKAEREIGDRLDAELGAIFDWSRRQSPGSYREAFDVGLARLRTARDTDRSGEADETAQQAQPEARAGAEGIAPPPNPDPRETE